jgi:CheY-like chemotaxis protein
MDVPSADRRLDRAQRPDLGLARIGTWHWDPHTGALRTSATCRHLLDLPAGDVTAASVGALIHPDDLPRLLSVAGDCLHGGAACRAQFRVRRGAGWRWMEVAGRRLRRRDEATGHLAGILVDVTEGKQAEDDREFWRRRTREALAELDRTMRSTGDLLRGASHDLRTPLNAILGWCHILASQADRPDQVRHVVEVIDRNARALARIVDGMSVHAPGSVAASGGDSRSEPASTPRMAPPASPRQLAGVRVLVVDDDRDSREFVRRVLLHAGADVEDVATCAQGLAVFARNPPDVVVSDIDLPDDSGYRLVGLLRARSPGRTVQAVAVTALARPSDAKAALDAGFQAHLAKPVRPADLCAAIGRLAASAPGRAGTQAAPDDVVPPGPGRLTP